MEFSSNVFVFTYRGSGRPTGRVCRGKHTRFYTDEQFGSSVDWCNCSLGSSPNDSERSLADPSAVSEIPEREL